MGVGLVVVSHSARLAEGVVEVARQMAADVSLAAAGGDGEGGIGTDLDRVLQAVGQVDSPDGVVLLSDLGSATMTADIAVEASEDPGRLRVVAAPLVEGTVAAAVAAQSGGDLQAVVRAAMTAWDEAPERDEPASGPDGTTSWQSVECELTNPLGLHARPAARLAALAAAREGTELQLRPADTDADGGWHPAGAVLAVVSMGLRGGARLAARARGPHATEALAELAALVADGFGERGPAPGPADRAAGGGGASARDVLVGVGTAEGAVVGAPAAPGAVVAPLAVVNSEAAVPPEASEVALSPSGPEVDAEVHRAREAGLAAARARQGHSASGGGAAGTDAAVMAVQHAVLTDPDLLDEVQRRVRDGVGAARAWWEAGEVAARRLEEGDELTAARAPDVRDAVQAVLGELGVERRGPDAAAVRGRVVLLEDCPPSWVRELVAAGAVGLASVRGSANGHVAVLAAARGLPYVSGLAGARPVLEGDDPAAEGPVLLDGDRGLLLLRPSQASLEGTGPAGGGQDLMAAGRAAGPVELEGLLRHVCANVADEQDARAAAEVEADGVGLLRTELMLDGLHSLPGEEEQLAALRAVVAALPAGRVVVRTFDIGGDKPVAGLDLDERTHGFLGVRGLRLALVRPEDVLAPQLRAVLRLTAEARERGIRIALMAPMVTTAEEFRLFRDAVERGAADLAERGVAHERPAELGVMVEVPAVTLLVPELVSAGVQFLSVGTNDLQQYLFAAERTLDAVASLIDPTSPALWRLLELLLDSATAAGVPVAVCGRLAADPDAAVRLARLGVTELSVPPPAVPRIRGALRLAAADS